METQGKNNPQQAPKTDQQIGGDKDRSLASDGPVSKAEGTDSPDLNTNDTAKSFDRDQEELDYGFREGDLDNDALD